MQIMNDFIDYAYSLHEKHPVADAHFDLPSIVSLLKKIGKSNIVEQLFLKDWQRAGLNFIGAAVYLDRKVLGGNHWQHAYDQIVSLYEDIKPLYPQVQIITSSTQLDQVVKNHYIGLLLYFEGLEPVEEDLSLLEEAYLLGIRGASLTWSRDNLFARGCCPIHKLEDVKGGLTSYGLEAMRKMESFPMFFDISHLNDDGIRQLHACTHLPYAATHSNARALLPHYRNLSDAQILYLANRGGVIGINAYKDLVCSKREFSSLDELCRHILYMVHLAGASHVGYGLDLCSMLTSAQQGKTEPTIIEDCLTSHKELPLVTAKLLESGSPEQDVLSIMGNNFISYFRSFLETSETIHTLAKAT